MFINLCCVVHSVLCACVAHQHARCGPLAQCAPALRTTTPPPSSWHIVQCARKAQNHIGAVALICESPQSLQQFPTSCVLQLFWSAFCALPQAPVGQGGDAQLLWRKSEAVLPSDAAPLSPGHAKLQGRCSLLCLKPPVCLRHYHKQTVYPCAHLNGVKSL